MLRDVADFVRATSLGGRGSERAVRAKQPDARAANNSCISPGHACYTVVPLRAVKQKTPRLRLILGSDMIRSDVRHSPLIRHSLQVDPTADPYNAQDRPITS